MKKFFKILMWVIIGVIFIGTFVYLYINSQKKEAVYELVNPTIETIERTTVLTGKIEPRDQIDIKPQSYQPGEDEELFPMESSAALEDADKEDCAEGEAPEGGETPETSVE